MDLLLSTETHESHRVTEFCLCPECRSELREMAHGLRCTQCEGFYEIRDSIPHFLPVYHDEERRRYFECYQRLAIDDLQTPLEENRHVRHSVLIDFIGDVRNKKVLDIGSSDAKYLCGLEARFKVAFDLARTYLAAIPDASGIVRICGDAECLPFKPGFFDVIIISDILEHLLKPENLITCLRLICRRNTRVIVHIPWEEDIEQYRYSKYQFAHLRTFSACRFAQLWQGFYVKRLRGTYPSLDEAILFKLQGRIPRGLYNLLVFLYFETSVGKWEIQRRSRWINELPKRERWLLYFYKPKFRIYELRSAKDSVFSVVYKLLQVFTTLRGLVHKIRTRLMIGISKTT